MLSEGPKILMKVVRTGHTLDGFILRLFKKEGLIIAMKFAYLDIGQCHSILMAFVDKRAENSVEMLVIGVYNIYSILSAFINADIIPCYPQLTHRKR